MRGGGCGTTPGRERMRSLTDDDALDLAELFEAPAHLLLSREAHRQTPHPQHPRHLNTLAAMTQLFVLHRQLRGLR